MLKFGCDILVPAVAKLFYLLLCLGKFPDVWNTTFQVPLYKKGDSLNCDSYRGISITTCLGKVFTALLSNRIQNFVSFEGKLSPFQAAFRKNHGTNDHIYTLRTLTNKYVRHYKLKLYCCFVDFRKAFDSVWSDGLFYKLRKLGVGGNMYKVLRNMYNKTKSCVKLPGGMHYTTLLNNIWH